MSTMKRPKAKRKTTDKTVRRNRLNDLLGEAAKSLTQSFDRIHFWIPKGHTHQLKSTCEGKENDRRTSSSEYPHRELPDSQDTKQSDKQRTSAPSCSKTKKAHQLCFTPEVGRKERTVQQMEPRCGSASLRCQPQNCRCH